jgi:23S rRNA (guanosine2251-2'-O)-methyltransferase
VDKTARPNRHAAAAPSAEPKHYDDLDLAGLLETTPTPLVLILDCITDPHNFGACLRTADAAGVTCVIVPKDKSAPVTETVRRVSCGGADHVPIVRVTNLARTMEKLKKAGLWLVGTSDAATQTLYQTDLKGPIGIVMGAEGDGMRRLTEENCDFLVNIPMGGSVECLNVSVATGVCLFEAVRQRLPAAQRK